MDDAARPVARAATRRPRRGAIAWLVLAIAAAAALVCAPRAAASEELDRYQRLEDMHHTAWTAKDGLTGAPFDIAQTADGYLWIGTTNGLFRFDGVAFERFQPTAGELSGVAVSTIRALRAGGLWVGYRRGGVTFIAPDGGITHYTDKEGVPVGVVRDFAEDHTGAIWVAVTGGLARFANGRWQTVRTEWNYPHRSAWNLLVTDDGTLWVGAASPNRLLFLPKGATRFQATDLTEQAYAIAQTGPDTVITLDGGHLYEVRRAPGDHTTTWRRLRALPGYNMTMDRQGGFWHAGHGVTRFRPGVASSATAETIGGAGADETFTSKDGLSGSSAREVLVDREQNVWVITESGLDRFRRRNLVWKAEPRVTESGGLVIDPRGDAWSVSWRAPSMVRARDGQVAAGAPEELIAAYPGANRTTWVTRNDGLFAWRDERFTAATPPREVSARGYRFAVMASDVDRDGRLWAAVNGVGQFYQEPDGRWTFVPVLTGDRADWTASKVHADARNRVWLAYRDELALVAARTMARLFTKADGLDVGAIQSIASRDDVVWVGGERGFAMLRGERFHAVPAVAALDLGPIADIVVTDDGLWLATALGIAHLPEPELQRLIDNPAAPARLRLLDLVSDLPDALRVNGRASTAVRDGGGVLWFLTNNGLARVDPRLIVRNTLPPPVQIRAVSADDRAYATRGVVALPALTRTLRIDYTALSLSIPERVRFRYRLDGWESDWHDAGARRTVFYTDLKPGRYAFRVLASNNDGVWNDTGAILAFTVAPAWYQTRWFQALVAIAAIGAVALLYQLRVRRVAAALSARFDARLAERTRLARDLHDTLLQTVQGSKMVADDALAHATDVDGLRRAVERLSDWLGRAVSEGRAALQSLRASTVEVNDLAEAFRRAADDPAKPAELTVSVVVRGVARNLHPIVRDEIYRIGYEAMRNVYAHARATRLEVELGYGQDLTLRLADNGVGIEPAIAESGRRGRFGLPGMRERAANIGGTLRIDSSTRGTSITLIVPGRTVFSSSVLPDASNER